MISRMLAHDHDHGLSPPDSSRTVGRLLAVLPRQLGAIRISYVGRTCTFGGFVVNCEPRGLSNRMTLVSNLVKLLGEEGLVYEFVTT